MLILIQMTDDALNVSVLNLNYNNQILVHCITLELNIGSSFTKLIINV